ncbi:hypothetical protein HQ32_02015 [Prauserella sp. Am3]|nr:hypothetical protein HQ32_02015 [Prauserella sp. Am3]
MSEVPELDQVADARRRLAAHARLPLGYWVFYGVALVALAGLPLWTSWLGAADHPLVSWGVAALGIASAGYAWNRRRRTGVHLPKRVGAYPSARPWWLAGLALTLAGFGAIFTLVAQDLRPVAYGVLPVVAIAVFALQLKTRSAMEHDLQEGRVRP